LTIINQKFNIAPAVFITEDIELKTPITTFFPEADEETVSAILQNGYSHIGFELAVPYYDGVVQGLWLATQDPAKVGELLKNALLHDELLMAGMLYTCLSAILEKKDMAERYEGVTLQ
jgi:hypothetical protein